MARATGWNCAEPDAKNLCTSCGAERCSLLRAKLSACQSAPRLKDPVAAAAHREQGNASFRGGHHAAALHQYALSALSAGGARELAAARANRSAALYHLRRYRDSLSDLAAALQSGSYPAERHHKLHVRRARCLLALDRPRPAADALTQYRDALAQLPLGPVARGKLEAEANALAADIERAAGAGDGQSGGGGEEKEDESAASERPVLEGGEGTLAGASSCLQLRETERKGRHVVTSEAVSRGSVLFSEEPYVCVLLPERRLDHCHHCLRHTHALLPCSRCADVAFCSAACRQAAGARYHAAECGHAHFLQAFGIGGAAVRVLLTAGWRRLRALRSRLQEDGGRCRGAACQCHRAGAGAGAGGDGADRYLAVFHLQHHLDETLPEDAYHYGRAAATLAVFLAERTAFFSCDAPSDGGGASEPPGAPPPEQWALRWTAGLLLRHLLQLICNAHAPTKLVPLPGEHGGTATPAAGGRVETLSEERIATAIYPSASYMNHSCDPSIINSFWGSTLVVRSVKELPAGAEVFHCYGPHYSRAPPAERRRQLLEQYHFLCDCPHCSRQELAQHLDLMNSLHCHDCGRPTLPEDGEGGESRRRCLACGAVHCYRQRLQRLAEIETEAEQVATSGGDISGDRRAVSRTDELLREAAALAPPTHETLYMLYDLHAKLCTRHGEPAPALRSLRVNLESAAARYGSGSVEVGNLLLTVTDVLAMALQDAAPAGDAAARRRLADELRRDAERGLDIFTIHYGPWSPAYRDLRRKLAQLRADGPV